MPTENSPDAFGLDGLCVCLMVNVFDLMVPCLLVVWVIFVWGVGVCLFFVHLFLFSLSF